MGKPKFKWDDENKVAQCYLTLNRKTYVGEAHCHPEDMDMASEKTGCAIAAARASIKLMNDYIENDLNPRLAALNKLYYSMSMSTKFNPKSYENKMLQRQIRLINNELDITKDLLSQQKEDLKEYLSKKEDFYKMVRSMRRVEKEEEKHLADN